MAYSSTELTFTNSDINVGLNLEIDDQKTPSRLKLNDTAYIKVYPSTTDLQVWASSGSVSVKKGLYEYKEEYIEFAMTDRAKLSHMSKNYHQLLTKLNFYRIIGIKTDYLTKNVIPPTTIRWEWVGRNPGINPVFIDDEIILAQKVNGLLFVTYAVIYDEIALTVKNLNFPTIKKDKDCKEPTVPVLVVAESKLGVGSIITDWVIKSCEDELGEKRPLTVVVNDACDNKPVPNAAVYIDNVFKGFTDEQGKLEIGMIAKGKHKITVKKSGYVSTDKDKIENDEFEI